MGKYSVEVADEAREHLRLIHKSGDKGLMKKVERLFVELSEHPTEGIGKPERLKHQLSSVWSRRLDRKHRMLYIIEEEVVRVFVLSVLGHYADK